MERSSNPDPAKQSRREEAQSAGVLRGRSAREILTRLVDEDPLDLRARADKVVREEAVLLDPGRLFDRAAARIAFEARRYRGDPPLDGWLAEQVARSMRELLREDRSEDQAGAPPADGWDPSHLILGEALGAEPAVARSLCVVFNDLPVAKREVFAAVVMYGRTIDGVAGESGRSADEVRGVLQEIFTILARVGQDPDDGMGGRT